LSAKNLNINLWIELFIFSSAVVVASNSVWQDISLELNSRMSKGSLHTFVYKDYHRIKEKLGFPLPKTSDVEIANATSLNDSDTNKDGE